jgi:hypothetical protein
MTDLGEGRPFGNAGADGKIAPKAVIALMLVDPSRSYFAPA